MALQCHEKQDEKQVNSSEKLFKMLEHLKDMTLYFSLGLLPFHDDA